MSCLEVFVDGAFAMRAVVVDGLPVNVCLAAGNVVDVTKFEKRFAVLEMAGLRTSRTVFDAGYWSAANVHDGRRGIRFLTRLRSNVRAC